MTGLLKKLTLFFHRWKHLAGLATFIVIAYLPLASFQFALKNDAFIYNFPNKYFFSEALKNGFIPYWNPYLNYGFPLFADPGFAWWQPLTWFFGYLGYTPYTFTIEVLVYIYIAAVGMFWLARQFHLGRLTAMAMGCMFACSGFFIGNLQHINFLTCAAFLPWVVGTWFNLQVQPSIKKAALAAVATYLLCTGGHPAIPIATIYFIFFIAIFYFFFERKKVNIKKLLIWNSCYLITTLLLLLPPVLSWLQLMPFYVRSEGVDQASTNQLGFTFSSYLSFLSPVSTIKNNEFFGTDVSMRNGYFSLLGFVSFAAVFFLKKNPAQKIFLLTGIVMLFFSLGGTIKQTIYTHLPLLKFIRTNGEFRVFPILCFILISGFYLNELQNNSTRKVLLKKIVQILSVVIAVMATVLLTLLLTSDYSNFSGSAISTSALKKILDKLTFHQVMLAGAIVCFILSTTYYFIIKKEKPTRFLYALIMVDLILNAWLLLPITGVGMKSVSTIAALLNTAPKGFPLPPLHYQQDAVAISKEEELSIGNWSWYDKRIVHKRIEYPSMLKSTEAYYNSADSFYASKPFAFLKNNKGSLAVKHFGPNKLVFTVRLQGKDTLVLLQNYYPAWKVFKNKKQAKFVLLHDTFFSVPLDTNDHTLSFNFSPFGN